MSDKSSIEWTDATWNPVRGCRKISPGCKHCYVEAFAERFRGVSGHAYEQGFDPRVAPNQLGLPLRWSRARRIFVNSMSDLFLDEFDFGYVDQVVATMILARAIGRGHFFQVLTKRSERMLAYLNSRTEDPEFLFNAAFEVYDEESACAVSNSINGLLGDGRNTHWPPRNISWGVSVEDRKYGLPRIDHLRAAPAAVRTLSTEPLLEEQLGAKPQWGRVGGLGLYDVLPDLGERLVAYGGAGGAGYDAIRLDDRKGGDPSQWPEDLRVRELPELPAC